MITFQDLHKATEEGEARMRFRPLVKEGLRERLTAHTCDRRSSKTEIQAMFPDVVFADGFSEEDGLWREAEAETDGNLDIRTRKVLDEVFASDPHEIISIMSHSGAIKSILRGEYS